MTDRKCIVCGKPRDGGRIWCGDDACLKVVLAMPDEEINAIREREAIEAWRQEPEGEFYIHLTPKDEPET
jgi:hypothetical protein